MTEISGKNAQQWALSNFIEFERSLNGESKLPFFGVRKEALESFTKSGFPTTSVEEWKYTNVSPISAGKFRLTEKPANSVLKALNPKTWDIFGDISGRDTHRLVFVDGYFIKEFSSISDLPDGVSIASMADVLKGRSKEISQEWLDTHLARYAPYTEECFVALNTAFVCDGAVIRLAKNVTINKPIEITFVTSPGQKDRVSYPRILVVLESGASAQLVESYIGSDESKYLTNSVLEAVLGQDANLTHTRLQCEGLGALHISSLKVIQKSNSNLQTATFSFGGALVRNDLNVELDGSGINTHLNGLTVISKDQHVDNHTTLDHAKPRCESREMYKGIYADRSTGVFCGSIIVRPDAQKTNAIQSNRSLLLSDAATINSKPQLKIWADDVKCTHGATVGQLDEDALFYLRSRGVGEDVARNMLVHAFASEVISEVKLESLRSHLESLLLTKLGKSTFGG